MKHLFLHLLPFLLLTTTAHPMLRAALGSKARPAARLFPASRFLFMSRHFGDTTKKTPKKETDPALKRNPYLAEQEAKEYEKWPNWTQGCKPTDAGSNTIVIDLRENAEPEKSDAPTPDYQVAVGQTFIIEKEEDLSKGEAYHFADSSNINLLAFENEYYSYDQGRRTHCFVFKAINKGTGTLRITGNSNRPEWAWMESYVVVVE
jgi:hypothetical protein